MKTLALALAIASAAAAQNGSVAGPVLGLVFDRDAGRLRPILGVPGAGLLGRPLESAATDAASAAEFAVTLEADGAAIVTTAGRRSIPGAAAGASRVVLSPRGSSAALYYPATSSAEVFTGLPDNPVHSRTIALSHAPAALSDDGATVLAIERNSREGDTLVQYGSSPAVLHRARRISAVAFLPGAATAVLADNTGLKLLSPSFGLQDLGDRAPDIVAVAASSNGGRIFAASRSGAIVIHDLRASTRATLSCNCELSTLAPLRGAAVFRLNDLASGPLWILDGDAPDPRIVFIPVVEGGSR